MANYTCIMLYISAFENENDRINQVNSYRNNDIEFSLIDVNDFNKYPDAFPRFLYVGSYKNFNSNCFIDFLINKVDWEYPEYVQLFIQDEDDYNLRVYSDAGKNLVLDSKKE